MPITIPHQWAAKLRTYHISYVQRKEAEGEVVQKFFEREEQVPHILDKNKEGASGSREKPQKELVPTPKAWRFIDYKALLARLIASARRGIKDLHVFVGSKLLVDQVEGSRIPKTKEAKKYREDVIDATAPFHRF
nr:hypothetical protein [Tanacetum cinerariifolium]